MTAAWTFEDDDGTCKAVATSPDAVLELTADRSAATVVVRYKGATLRGAAPLRLSGPAGSWSLPGRTVGRAVQASGTMDENAASRLLVLLSGGTLSVGRAGGISLPNAGPAGKTWFECVRRQLLP